MLTLRTILVTSVVITIFVGMATAQDFPSKPIRFVAPAAGGGADIVVRLVAQGLATPLGQPVVIDNRPSGVIQGQIVFQAPADGHTLLFAGSTFWLSPFVLGNKALFDPLKDFTPITLTSTSPNLVVVHPTVAVTSVKELIALAKAKPGELNYARPGAGGPSHLAAELFKAIAGVDIVSIPYKGGSAAVLGLISGEVQVSFSTVPSAAPHVQTGKLRALAVTSARPSVLFPTLPTVAASGLPKYETSTRYGIFAPPRAPAAVINRLNREAVRILHAAEVKDKLFIAGIESVGSAAVELESAVKAEMNILGKLITDLGIRSE